MWEETTYQQEFVTDLITRLTSLLIVDWLGKWMNVKQKPYIKSEYDPIVVSI